MENETKYFSADWHLDDAGESYTKVFSCVGFDMPWNGWATPIVNREQLEDFASNEEGVSIVDDALTFTYDDPEYGTLTICPDRAGLFHLSQLGWCFVELTEEEYEDAI